MGAQKHFVASLSTYVAAFTSHEQQSLHKKGDWDSLIGFDCVNVCSRAAKQHENSTMHAPFTCAATLAWSFYTQNPHTTVGHHHHDDSRLFWQWMGYQIYVVLPQVNSTTPPALD